MKIGVVSLGLIGGSIFKKLQSLNKYEIVGVSSSVEETNVSNDYNTLKNCDIVFVCSPMNAVLSVLDKINNILDSKTIVTDVSSLKEFVADKEYNFKFIPSHPMAGTEHKGWNASFAELFEGATWALTPSNKIEQLDIDILVNLIKELGAKPLITTAKEHDEAVALISHFPMVVAQALCENIKNNSLAQKLAASGFRDTTRLALSNIEMATDMVEMNSNNIELAKKSFNKALADLLNNNYTNKAKDIKIFRENLY